MNAGDAGLLSVQMSWISLAHLTAHILASIRSFMYSYVFIQINLSIEDKPYKDAIKIRAMDVQILPTSPEPTPFSVDKNITAYLIPIFSTTDPASPEPHPPEMMK